MTPGYALEIELNGAYAFVIDWYRGLRVIDISDPAKPFEAGFLSGKGSSWGIDVSGQYAYLACGSSGMRIIDISDPAKPVETGLFDSGVYAFDVNVSGNYAYVADGQGGLRILDVSNPSKPFETGLFNTDHQALGVTVHDNLVFVADYDDGLYIIRNDLITGVNDFSGAGTTDFILEDNFPNPFNSVSQISYTLPFESFVKLSVYDLTGREIKTLVNQRQPAGKYSISFDATDLYSGFYFYKLQAGSSEQSRKVILLR